MVFTNFVLWSITLHLSKLPVSFCPIKFVYCIMCVWGQLHILLGYQCQGIWVDLDGCLAFTWTSDDTPELRLVCLLFSATSNQTFCEGCVSGPARCTCSKEEACVSDDNFLENIPGVLEEGKCQNVCARTPSCMFYTWHDATTFYPYTCVLLTSCDQTESCSRCFSGPSVCSSGNPTTTPAPVMEGKCNWNNTANP